MKNVPFITRSGVQKHTDPRRCAHTRTCHSLVSVAILLLQLGLDSNVRPIEQVFVFLGGFTLGLLQSWIHSSFVSRRAVM